MIENLVIHKKFPFIFIILGIILRVIWVGDMEWHYDAHYVFHRAIEIVNSGNWPLLGMENGARFQNPAFSLWVFAIIAFFGKTPIAMTSIIIAMNVAAILGFLYLIIKKIPKEEQIYWLLGLALVSVSPLPILWSRKIWSQDLMPFFSFLIILGHLERKSQLGALLWGIIGALVGQIHMSGFFFSFGLFIVTVIFDIRNKKSSSNWIFWIIGSLIGSIPLVPWLHYLSVNDFGQKREWKYVFQFKFFVYWLMESLGIHLKYILKDAFIPFLKGPKLFNMNTYFIGILHSILWLSGTLLGFRVITNIKKLRFPTLKSPKINIYLWSLLAGMGISLTFGSVKIYPHYLVILFPFIQIWLVKVLFQDKKVLFAIFVAQSLISIIFFTTIHTNNGIQNSHYGKTYHQKCIVEKIPNCQNVIW
jgi:hypothetical protein